MNREELRLRTKQFAIRIVRLVAALPKDRIGDVLGRQILKSGTSIGANYREGLRASSRRHFISILQISVREADETLYWLEILADTNVIKVSLLSDLTNECESILKILASTVKSAKRSSPSTKSPNPKSPNQK